MVKSLSKGLLLRSTSAAFVFLIMFLFKNYTIGNYLETMLPYFIFALISTFLIAMFSHLVKGKVKNVQNVMKKNNPKIEEKQVNNKTKVIKFNIDGFMLVTVFVSFLLGFNIIELETYGKIIIISETMLFIIVSLSILKLLELEKKVR